MALPLVIETFGGMLRFLRRRVGLTQRELSIAVGYSDAQISRLEQNLRGARVVKAFNSTGAGNMADTDYGAEKPSMFLCGDDPPAKVTVSHLASELGFEPVDCGPLTSARYLEPLCGLWITLAYKQGLGPDIAFRLVRRAAKGSAA